LVNKFNINFIFKLNNEYRVTTVIGITKEKIIYNVLNKILYVKPDIVEPDVIEIILRKELYNYV